MTNNYEYNFSSIEDEKQFYIILNDLNIKAFFSHANDLLTQQLKDLTKDLSELIFSAISGIRIDEDKFSTINKKSYCINI